MMPQVLPLRSGSDVRRTYRLRDPDTADGDIYTIQVRTRWLSWVGAATVSFYRADESAIETGNRLTPGESPVVDYTHDGLPPGRFIVSGPDAYSADDVGAIELEYWTSAELAAL